MQKTSIQQHPSSASKTDEEPYQQEQSVISSKQNYSNYFSHKGALTRCSSDILVKPTELLVQENPIMIRRKMRQNTQSFEDAQPGSAVKILAKCAGGATQHHEGSVDDAIITKQVDHLTAQDLQTTASIVNVKVTQLFPSIIV